MLPAPRQTGMARKIEPFSGTTKLKAAEAALAAASSALEACEDELRAARHDVLARAGVEDAEIGSWDCGKSPIGICAYAEDEGCVFCGEPDERK